MNSLQTFISERVLYIILLFFFYIPPSFVSSQTSSSSQTSLKNDTTQIVHRTSYIVNHIDSLKQALLTTKEDTTKILLLRKIGDAYNYLQESLPYL